MDTSIMFVVNLSQSNESHTYGEVQKQYKQILSDYENTYTKYYLGIDISGTRLSQGALNKVMHDLFFIHKIEDDPIKGPFIHKFFEVKHITINAGFTTDFNLDFLSTFFIYRNIESITLDCDDSQALSFLNICKTVPPIPLTCCKSYFTKRFSIFELHQTGFLSLRPIEVSPLKDQIKAAFAGIEDQIEIMNCDNIDTNEYPIWIKLFSELTNIKRLSITIFSLSSDIKYLNPQLLKELEEKAIKSHKKLVAGIQKNLKFINQLTFCSYTDFLLPPIKNELFQSPCSVCFDYQQPNIKLEVSQILKKALMTLKPEHNLDSFILNPHLNRTDSNFYLNFKSRMLSDTELEEIVTFITKASKYEFPKIFKLEFSPKQQILNSQWVSIISNIAKNESIQHVEINGTDISVTVAALSVTKLVKMKKKEISINKMGLSEGQLNLCFNQITDHMLDVIMRNLFENDARKSKEILQENSKNQINNPLLKTSAEEYPNSIEDIVIKVKRVIVDLVMPPSEYLKYIGTKVKRVRRLSIQVNGRSSDIHLFIRSALNDRDKLHKFVSVLDIQQDENIHFQSTEGLLHYNMFGKYAIGAMEIPYENMESIRKQVSLANTYHSINSKTPFKMQLKIFDLYCSIRQAHFTKTSLNRMPAEMLVFYRYAAPYIPINPYQLFTDLYY